MLRMTLGNLYHSAGRFGDAIASYEHCLRLSPGHGPARSRIASVMISQRRFAEAEELLSELIDGGDSDPVLLHNRGIAIYHQERWDDASMCFMDAAARGLQHSANFAYLARSLHHLGSMADAIDACRGWVALANDSESKSYLALLYLDTGDVDNAKPLAREVLAKHPDDINANVVNGIVSVEMQEIAAARRHFETALRHDKTNGRAWLGLGLVHLHEQEHAKAIEALENSIRIHPKNLGAIVTLGWAKLMTKDLTGAQETFEHALRVDRTFGESHGGLAAALALQREFDKAETEIKLARRLNPHGFGAEFAHAAVLAEKGERQSAVDLLTDLLKRAPREGMLPLIEQLRVHAIRKRAH
ncbi:MAG TPA: tetratricopeptide repeat protein [Paucimonas sp.]|nr:tetratricopeptide repeat protein [Paucimonas sp.]